MRFAEEVLFYRNEHVRVLDHRRNKKFPFECNFLFCFVFVFTSDVEQMKKLPGELIKL